VRDFTNLAWPEVPFGADQRPFGAASDMLAAATVEWAPQRDGEPVPVAVTTVYLRARRHGSVHEVDDDSLAVGFRATVAERPGDLPALVGVLDRALTRARRHAIILAGHRLDADLSRLQELSEVPLRGADGVIRAWAQRDTRERGVALMIDTAVEAHPVADALGFTLAALPAPIPNTPSCAGALAREALARCLAVGLTAAVHAGRYRWEGSLRLGHVIDRNGWDLFDTPAPSDPTGPAEPANA
jgi:hypothetical protein